MPHHNQSIRERVIALVEEGNLTAVEAGRRYVVPELRGGGSSGIGKLVGELVKRNTAFPGCPRTVRNRMREAGLRSRSAAVKEKLSEEHRLYRLAFAEDNVDRDWGNVIFSDESMFSSANEGPVRVCSPRGTRYNAEYVKESARSGRVSVAVWGRISSRRIGLLHRTDGRLDGVQYLHILRDIMVPSVREMYPDGVINFQQDQSPVHKSLLLKGWLADQNEVELLDWPT
jgi:hypothetical protein